MLQYIQRVNSSRTLKYLKLKNTLPVLLGGNINTTPLSLLERFCPRLDITTLFSTASFLYQSKKNHYEVLNITQSASSQEIRDAFLNLSKEFHPDINRKDPDNHQKFISVNEAYTVLIKPLSRRDYDVGLKTGQHRQQSTYSPPGYGYPSSYDYDPFFHHGYKSNTESHSGSHDEKPQGLKWLAEVSFNFYTVTTVLTFGFVIFILTFKEVIVPDNSNKQRSLPASYINAKDYIMTSYHEGKPVHYYAVKDDINPEAYKIFAVMKKELSGNESEDDHEYEVQVEETSKAF